MFLATFKIFCFNCFGHKTAELKIEVDFMWISVSEYEKAKFSQKKEQKQNEN
jgi:hypothetical protein